MKNFIKHFFVQFVAILACLAVVGGVMLFVRPRLGKGAKHAEAASVVKEAPVAVELEEFTVNLADTDQARFLKVTVVLEIPGEGGGHKAAGPKVEEFKPQIRHAIIMTLTRQYFHALQSPEGKEQLREQIKEQADEALNDAGITVEGVLFTEFVMQ